MKICLIGTVGIPASYGGFETLAERLIDTDNAKFTVYCSGNHYKDRPKKFNNADLVYIPFDANGFSSIFYDLFSMLHAFLSGHKNFLVLGVSGAIFFPLLRCFPNVKIITNIDGIEWKREKWKALAKSFLKFSELLAVKFSTKVVSDNEAITDYIAKEYQVSCKTIAYGGDHAIRTDSVPSKSIEKYGLALCRIEPENNIEMILRAFSYSQASKILFIGNWDNSQYGRLLKKKYSTYENIRLHDPVYDLDELFKIRSGCSFYIHGHSAGGTNPSLVEMMHFCKPIVAYDCVYNRKTMEGHGSFFSSSKDLNKIIESKNVLPGGDELGRVAKQRYTWNTIREKYLLLFN